MPIDLEWKGCIDGARKAAGVALFCFIDCKSGGYPRTVGALTIHIQSIIYRRFDGVSLLQVVSQWHRPN